MQKGNGQDGVWNITSPTTDAPIDSSCSGSSGSDSLSATNASFTAGQLILIIQMRGTDAGKYEVNQIEAYVAGTITTVSPLANTYTDSGNSQAQVIVLKQYSEVNINDVLTAKAWTGDVGGVVAFLCSGRVKGTGSIAGAGRNGQSGGNGVSTGNGGGFRGGNGAHTSGVAQAQAGEGSTGAAVAQTTANGNGGGGAKINNVASAGFGGGGGGHSAAGSAGTHSDGGSAGGGSTVGAAGGQVGAASLATLFMGGGGGGGANDGSEPSGAVASGGNGGCIVFIQADYIDCSLASGFSISVNGGNGGDAGPTAGEGGDGGGGAAGSIFLKARVVLADPTKVTAIKGQGGDIHGGDGADGRIRIEACTLTGTTNPANPANAGGYGWCSGASQII